MVGIRCKFHERGDLRVARPHIFQIDGFTVAAGAERIFGQIRAHRTGDAVGNNQCRTGEVICAQVGVHARFEVAIAGEHRTGDEVFRYHGFFDFRVERAGGTHTGGAAVGDDAVAAFYQIRQQAGIAQVIGDDFGARRE